MKKANRKNDYVGMAASVVTHGLLMLLLSFVVTGASEVQPIGFIEVDFGPVMDGRPVQRSAEPDPDALQPTVTQPEQLQPESSAPDKARPTDVPDQTVEDEEAVSSSEAETISPLTEANPERTRTERPTPPRQETTPSGAGVPEGSGGANSGTEGTGTDEQKTAPFQIEGLNRVPVTAPVPDYSEKVNAVIKIRITVDPTGRIVQRIPLMKGNPALEKSVMETLSTWRFNPLPPNAPQENQTGAITFRFRLE